MKPNERDLIAVINYLWEFDDMRPVEKLEKVPVNEVLIAPFSERRTATAIEKTRRGGIMPPIYVQRLTLRGHNFYIVTDGQHRTQASRILGRKTIAAHVLSEAEIDTSKFVVATNGLFRATPQTPATGSVLLVAWKHQFTEDQWAALEWLFALE